MLRFGVFFLAVLICLTTALLAWSGVIGYEWCIAASPLVMLGVHDVLQRRHSILRNYPVIGWVRFLTEAIRPQIRQYLLESDTGGMPFNREHRSVVYQRAKDVEDKKPFGTEQDVYAAGYEWINHSIAPVQAQPASLRIDIGNRQCRTPYSASVFNISAMSFGALGRNAIRALNKGARMGNFAHDSGEGGISMHHREFGGDLIWEIGSGYFGCRDAQGRFEAQLFAEQALQAQVKMIEVKLSQGAKPGHGGILPAAKVTREIAETRKVLLGHDCVSPACHGAFATPTGFLQFVSRLRELSGGKPVGFKLCVGHPWEFMAICKAMLQTGIVVDFIVVDGKEGGTGAAPVEFSDHIGMPLREGLIFVHNTLIGCGLRNQIRLGASGKIVTGFHMATIMALGADWCNSARGFMFALGCLQSQRCHTDRCPTGIATQDELRQRSLVVPDKAQRVHEFHRETVIALAEILAAAGLQHASQLRPQHISRRIDPHTVKTAAEIYQFLAEGELLSGCGNDFYRRHWDAASADRFGI